MFEYYHLLEHHLLIQEHDSIKWSTFGITASKTTQEKYVLSHSRSIFSDENEGVKIQFGTTLEESPVPLTLLKREHFIFTQVWFWKTTQQNSPRP